MATVFDIIDRKQANFHRITGFEIKYHQLAGAGITFNTMVYSQKVAEIMLKEINSEIDDPINYIRVIEEPIEIKEYNASYRVMRWKVEIPYSALSGNTLLRLEKKIEMFRELSITSHTIRDHFFSFMNSATNFASCIRESENLLEENLEIHTKQAALNE